MIHLLRIPELSNSPTRRLRAFVAPATLALLVTIVLAAPSTARAEEEAAGSRPSDTAKTAWVATKDGTRQVVVTPEQEARRAARKAKRAARHAAEKTKALSKEAPESVKQGAADAAAKTKEGAAKVGDKVNGTEGAE